ncbi:MULTISPECIES: hypothetical protein [Flammeovirga]|uniref:Uncharacterized protein n=1 Tax=Flammeovirga agarivorans TaxID=2726742 RepID=A0A7X8SM93_9BACT|nr:MULTISPECIES: hypothetical protein [Flammeovirga]NLR92757.1 hypothetical protein [Flammeovirga agarivorans]
MQLDKKTLNKEYLNKALLLLYKDEQDILFTDKDLKDVLSDPRCESFISDSLRTKAHLDKFEVSPRPSTIKNIMDFAKKAIDNKDSN